MSFSPRIKFVLVCFVAVLALLAHTATSFAQQATRNILNNEGNVVFQLDFYGEGQGSTNNFSAAQITAIEEAAQYWVDMLKGQGTMPDGQPVVFAIYYDENIVGNANASPNGFVQSAKDGFNLSLPEAVIVDGMTVDPNEYGGAHATINVGSGWNFVSGEQSAVGRVAGDFTPVMIHELGHALGILSSLPTGAEFDPVTGEVTLRFPDIISRYDSRLRDNNGNSPIPKLGADGKIAGYDDPADGRNADTIFDMGDPNAPPPRVPDDVGGSFGNPSQVTFVGKNVLELWYGKSCNDLSDKEKNKGVPILGYTYGPDLNYPYDLGWHYTPGGSLGHINTTNSLMSWQAYRNYPGFIEIELAVMQDLGYDVERSNFFGKSFYVDGDGETPFYNSTNFGYWNAAEQRYDMTKANDASYAIGAHLFAKNLNVFQTGNIWANGPGAAGVRIDGSHNQFTLTRGTTIRTDGVNGIGLVAAYGKDHTVTLQQGSEVHATGRGGIGVAFDFGVALAGDTRGSYYYGMLTDTVGMPLDIGYLPELYGSLINDFNVSGTITAGTKPHHNGTYRTHNVVTEEDLAAMAEALLEQGYTQEEIDAMFEAGAFQSLSWLEPWANPTVSRPFDYGAAIHIDETAAVDRINIMQGAVINGDILSHWTNNASTLLEVEPGEDGTTGGMIGDPLNAPEVVTAISFGYKADANGNATNQVDKDFKFVFKDNINYYRYELHPNILVHLGNGEYVSESPASEGPLGNDTFWEFITWDEGFFTTWDGGRYASSARVITRPGDGYVYADIITAGAQSTALHFVGGVTEFQGTSAFVKEVKIDRDATLILTPAVQSVDSTLTIDGTAYEVSRLDDVFKMPEIHIGADFYQIPLPDIYPPDILRTWVEPHPNPPTMVNEGRIAGSGAFYFGQRRYGWDGNMQELHGRIGVESWYWDGTLRNNGTIAPGAKNGAEIGTILIQGDLVFGQYGVYEVTIGGPKEVRYHSGILPDGKFVDQNGMIYDRTIGQFRGNNITGEQYVEADGPYPVQRTPFHGTGNDLIVVSNNTKMDGTLKINVLPDSVFANERSTHTIIQSGSFTAGSNFDQIDYAQGFLYISDVFINPQNAHEAQITVSRELDYFEKRAKTANEMAVAKAIDSSLFYDPQIAFSLGDERNTAADLRDVYRQMGASSRANGALINLWSPSELLFNRIGWGNGQMDTGERGRIQWRNMMGNASSGAAGKTRGQAPTFGQCAPRQRTGSIWGDYFNTTFNAESDGNSDKYNIMRNGFMVGGEWNLTPYSAIGALAAYADSKLDQRGDKIKSDDYMLGLYFVAAPFNKFEVKGYIGTGFQQYDFDRGVRNANIYTDSMSDARGASIRYLGDTNGNTLNMSLELAKPWMLHPTFILRPTLGLDAQFMWQDGFTETMYKEPGYSYPAVISHLEFRRMKFNRTLLRAGFSTETSGSRGSIRMRAFYVSNLGDDLPVSNARLGGYGDWFAIEGVQLGDDFLNLGVGTNVWLDGEQTSSLFLEYDANVYNMSGRKMDSHTFSLGFLQNF